MTLRRKLKKWLYGSCPGLAGSFPYCGVKTYFPKGSSIFARACEQGIYEASITRLLVGLTRPGTTMLDVGANIGLTSLPVLHARPTAKVISFEPSPNTLGSLRRTRDESALTDRWQVMGKAAGRAPGTIDFFISSADLGDFDSLVDTGRSGERRKVTVDVTTLDEVWEQQGRPAVSVIKIDVEGAETDVLAGARKLVESERPHIILEWYEDNLKPYGYDPASLLDIAAGLNCKVVSVPGLVPVDNAGVLKVHMITADAFMLVP